LVVLSLCGIALKENDYKRFIQVIQSNSFVVSAHSNERLTRQSGAFIIPTAIKIIKDSGNNGDLLVRKARCNLDEAFEKDSFDAIICSMSFHHYPNPQAFFDSVKRCLRPNGRLILRDVTSDNKILIWLMNTLEMPLANICGHGDVRVPTRDVVMECSRKAGLKVEKFEIRKGMRMHCVVRKA